jgi:hypothetical protein
MDTVELIITYRNGEVKKKVYDLEHAKRFVAMNAATYKASINSDKYELVGKEIKAKAKPQAEPKQTTPDTKVDNAKQAS